MKQITIKIAPDGIITADTINMHGEECQKYISILEELLNAVAIDSSYKKEFYTKENTEEKVTTLDTSTIKNNVSL